MVSNSAATVILVAAGKPTWTLLVTVPLPILALVGNLWAIPHLGALGAASVTASLGVVVSIVSITLVYHLWQVLPPIATLVRSLLVSILIYSVAVAWSVSGLLILVKLTIASLLIPAMFLALGEFKAKEIHLFLSVIPRVGKRGRQ